MKRKSLSSGFSLAELIVALTVVSIVMTAVATLAYTLSSAYDGSSDISEKQSVVRHSSLRILELIRHSKLICAESPTRLVLWRADDNGNNEINISEITYLETGIYRNYLRLLEFTPHRYQYDISLRIQDIQRLSIQRLLVIVFPVISTTLIPDCEGIEISLDRAPPDTTFVNITFDINQDGLVRTYQISSALRCRAGNLIDRGELMIDDD